MTIRTYDVYFMSKHRAPKKWEIHAKDAFHARCTVEEMNPDCKITRVLLQDDSQW